jgi:uncharacterized protein YcgI (DUF1989 family)
VSDTALVREKYGMTRFQEQRNEMFRSGLDGMLIELGKWGLGMRDMVANINFFSKVTADATGAVTFHSGNSKAGDYVDLSFEMDTLMVISSAPHPLDAAKLYRPGAVGLAAFATPPSAASACARIPENMRALQNTRHLYGCDGGAV